eukprot:jgi/Ulvmu1/12020/UM083_0033.1
MGDSAPSAHAPALLLDGDDADRDDQPYDSFKIISRKALSDYKKAERIFLDFLAAADVWSQDEVTATIIDFHLVEKCRTKFRAFVKSHGARVKFDPVEGTPRKQEYHGTVTVTRACKQQFLTQNPQVLRPGKTVCPPGEHSSEQADRVILQCAAPTPITTGAQHIPFSADDSLDAVWDRPQIASDFVSPRQAFHGQPSPRDTTTGVPPLRPATQDAPGPGTGSLGTLPWVTLEASNALKPNLGTETALDPADGGAQIAPAWRAFETHGPDNERFREELAKDRSWPDLSARAPGLANLEGLSLSQTLAGHSLRNLPPIGDRPRRLSLQDAFTSQICPPGLPGGRPNSISATGEDLLSHMHSGASGSIGAQDPMYPSHRPMLRARRTSAPVGAAAHLLTPFSSIAELPARSNAADWFTRQAPEPGAAMPAVGVRRTSEVHSAPHLSPRKSLRLDVSLHDGATSPRQSTAPLQYPQLRPAAADAPGPDPFAAGPLDSMVPTMPHLPPAAHRLRRQSDTDLLRGPGDGAALAPDSDLEGLRQLLSTDASASRQAISASLPPRMASVEGSQRGRPAAGAPAGETQGTAPPRAEGVAEALLDTDTGMRCVSYSFPSVSPSQASPVGSPEPPGDGRSGAGTLWNLGTDGGAFGVGRVITGTKPGSSSDFGDVAGGMAWPLHGVGAMPRSLADLRHECGSLSALDRDGDGAATVGMQRSLSARDCPTIDGPSPNDDSAAPGSSCEATDKACDNRITWPGSRAEHFRVMFENKAKRTSM